MLRDDTSPVKARIKSMSEVMPHVAFSACGNTRENMTKSRGKGYSSRPAGEGRQSWSSPADGAAGARLELPAPLITSTGNPVLCPVVSQTNRPKQSWWLGCRGKHRLQGRPFGLDDNPEGIILFFGAALSAYSVLTNQTAGTPLPAPGL
jgi:hypothetical protein